MKIFIKNLMARVGFTKSSYEKLKSYNGIEQFKTIPMMISPINIGDILLENNVPNEAMIQYIKEK